MEAGKTLLSVFAFVLGLIGAIEGCRAQGIVRQIQINTLLSEAWDLMGQQQGTVTIALEVRPSSSQLELANRKISDALLVGPLNAEGHRVQGAYLWYMNRRDEAIASYRTAIRLDQGHAGGYNNLGVALYVHKKDIEGATSALRTAIALNRFLATPRVNLGTIYFDGGKVDEAIKEFQDALELEPDSALALYNLGSALIDTGQVDNGRRMHERAYAVMPSLKQAAGGAN